MTLYEIWILITGSGATKRYSRLLLRSEYPSLRSAKILRRWISSRKCDIPSYSLIPRWLWFGFFNRQNYSLFHPTRLFHTFYFYICFVRTTIHSKDKLSIFSLISLINEPILQTLIVITIKIYNKLINNEHRSDYFKNIDLIYLYTEIIFILIITLILITKIILKKKIINF